MHLVGLLSGAGYGADYTVCLKKRIDDRINC